MNLKNEIFEGIAAYKGITPTSQDRYYDYLLENAQKKRKDDAKVEASGQAEVDRVNAAGGAAPVPAAIPVPTIASTATPGTVPTTPRAFDPSQPVGPNNRPTEFRRGGMARQAIHTGYRAGGPVTPRDDPYDDFMTHPGIVREPYRRGEQEPLLHRAPDTGEEGDPDSRRRELRDWPQTDTHDYSRPKWGEDDDEPTMPEFDPRDEAPYMEKRYQAGGNVDDPTDPGGGELDLPPVDQLVLQLLKREGGSAASRISRGVGEPWTVPGAGSEWHGEGADERARQLAKTQAAQARDAQAMVTSAPPVQPSSRAGRVLNAISEVVNPVGSGGEYERRQREQADLRAARGRIPGAFEASTEAEIGQAREAANQRQREQAERTTTDIKPAVDDYINARNQVVADSPTVDVPGMPPSAPPMGAGAGTASGPQPKPTEVALNTDRPVSGDPSAYGPVMQRPAGDPDYTGGDFARPGGAYPSTPAAAKPPAAPPPAKPSGPSGTTQTPAPPPGAGGANAPTSGRKGLRDPTRQEAFDPALDANDPYNAHRVTLDYRSTPQTYTQQDVHNVVAAGMTMAPGGGQPPVIGQGAVSRPVFNQWVAAHSNGGRLTPGQALMVGMVGKYKELLNQGRAAEAAHMAWGLMQAANLEAAAYGHVALDQLRGNNLYAAVGTIAKAADMSTDGMHHRQNGLTIETYDNTGKITAVTPIDGRQALAAAMGLSDGSLMWAALQQAASVGKKADVNAEGRQLTNELRRQQIEGARLRNRRLGQGGRGGVGQSDADRQMAQLFQQTGVAPPDGGGGGRSQGDDLPIDYNPTDPTEPVEP
jgi:hypothetical protein